MISVAARIAVAEAQAAAALDIHAPRRTSLAPVEVAPVDDTNLLVSSRVFLPLVYSRRFMSGTRGGRVPAQAEEDEAKEAR